MRNKSIFIFLIYLSFFILIPIIKNETRLIEKKIESFENKIVSLGETFNRSKFRVSIFKFS